MSFAHRLRYTAIFLFLCVARGHAQNYAAASADAFRAHDYQRMIQIDRSWTAAEPNNANAWMNLGTAYGIGLRQPEQAIAPLRRAVELEPGQPVFWHALGVSYLQSNHFGEAVTAIKRGIELNPNQPTYYNNLAAAYSGGGAFHSASVTLDSEKALAQRLHNAQVWYVLGNGFGKLGDAASAENAYRQAVNLSPRYAAAWTNLGAALEFAGNDPAALQAYRRGQALGDPLAQQNIAQMQAAERARQAQGGAGGNLNYGRVVHLATWLSQHSHPD